MKKQALILHAWYENPGTQWYLWLKKELEQRRYEVFVPNLPTLQTDLPDMEQALQYINKELTIDKHTIIIGHSIGCLLALRLAEKYSYKKMFLVAGWDYDDLTEQHRLFWKKKIDHTKIKHHVKEIYCISSDNDPYTTAFTVEEMSKRLDGKFIFIKGAGHFTDKFSVTKIPEVLQYL